MAVEEEKKEKMESENTSTSHQNYHPEIWY